MQGFYESLAEEYDALTSRRERERAADLFVAELLARYAPTSVLEVACGTGLYAVALASRGLSVVGTDLSTAMLDVARRRADDAGVSVEWSCLPMQDAATGLCGSFNAVLCMGNSLPHLLTDGCLSQALDGFYQRLSPGGVAVVQLLNFARLRRRNERVIGVDRHGSREYVRFYDFGQDRVQFNVLRLEWEGDTCRHELSSTELRMYGAEVLSEALIAAGFQRVREYGGVSFPPYDADQSETLMLVAERD